MRSRRLLLAIVTFCAVLTGGCAGRAGTRPKSAGFDAQQARPHHAGDDAVGALDYIEYRAQPELGQVSLFTGSISGPRTAERVARSAVELAKQGILVCSGDAPRTLHRSDKLGNHTFETLVLAQPPDPAEPEAPWIVRLLVMVGGRLKVDCSLGDAGAEADLFVYGVQFFPEDGTLAVTASDAEGHELMLPDGVTSLDDETVITDDLFESPPEDEPEPDRPEPVRV
jgi:hypothetical protein